MLEIIITPPNQWQIIAGSVVVLRLERTRFNSTAPAEVVMAQMKSLEDVMASTTVTVLPSILIQLDYVSWNKF